MMFYAIDSFYIFSFVIIGLCLVYILLISVVFPIIRKNKVKKAILNYASSVNKQVLIINNNTNGNTFKIKVEDKVYNAKVVKVSKNCDLQINNFETWVVFRKCLDGNYKTKTIPNMTLFMNSKMENKIVLLSAKAKTIKKYINESEMVMVDSSTNVYGVNILNFSEYNSLFK